VRSFRKILIANRGEIAVRVIRTLREMGISTVAVYSDADRDSQHVRMADEAVRIGAPPSAESYLHIQRVIDAACARGAEAIHPGYGFLSENPEFADACDRAGLAFIGPTAGAIRRMGSKTEARRIARAAGAPVVPGTGPLDRIDDVLRFASEHDFPIMLKAVAGGGGKGMRLISAESELAAAFRDASSEAERAFDDPRVYAEKAIVRPRHIEIQLIGDTQGNLVHLGERECSIQRRHQKVMEECPSPLVAANLALRDIMGEAAVRVARAAGYHNAGTIEFLVDASGQFYFLEMNTRLQVEHPVTEMVTGLDLVRLQVEVAAGARLPFSQSDIGWRGAAIECRIYAEDPDNEFFPSPGMITRLTRPAGPGVRVDGAVYTGWTVPIDYDPLLAKVAVWAETREHAIERAVRALSEHDVGGIKTNIRFFRQILEDPKFRAGDLHTEMIDEFFARHSPPPPDPCLGRIAALAAALSGMEQNGPAPAGERSSPWKQAGMDTLLR
jgi:acetyl-CoA carboxylase biotin carboxylase subunit